MDQLRQLLNEKSARESAGPRILVEIDSRTSGAVGGGLVVEVGKGIYEIGEKHLAELEALVERDRAGIEAARVDSQRHHEVMIASGKNERSFAPSMEASFRHLTMPKRDVKPFDSVRRVEDKASGKKS